MSIAKMIASHPAVGGDLNEPLALAVRHAMFCSAICTSCADACLAEGMVQELRQCIRLDLDCADVCAATGSVASRRTGSDEPVIGRMLEACETACRLCAEECERHAGMHEHCRICAQSCRRCEEACRQARESMGH